MGIECGGHPYCVNESKGKDDEIMVRLSSFNIRRTIYQKIAAMKSRVVEVGYMSRILQCLHLVFI
jgi:hypothetical protein